MPKITFSQAKEFLDNINDKDCVAVIHHNDGDGFASGIIFYDWCKNKGAEVENFIFNFCRWDKKISLEKFNKIIITDIAPGGIEELSLPTDKEIFYTDHHPEREKIPEEILELRTSEEGYIPSSRTAGELTNIKPWLSVAGTITDAGDLYPENDKFINEFLNKEGISLEKFKEEVSHVLGNTLVYFQEDLQEAFKIMKEINSLEDFKKLKKYSEQIEDELSKIIKRFDFEKKKLGDVYFFYFETKYFIKKPLSAIISRNNPEDTIIFATPIDEENLSISARNQSKTKDMAELLRAGIKGLDDASAGGHIPAAGGQILTKDLEKFKENIRNFLKE
ncbi:DHH family phosphoesterase [Candidatus Pacearchaeota archaeon]|nr:DHH family phosphoesterase [Candidatus Pacearchaeota archaeon]